VELIAQGIVLTVRLSFNILIRDPQRTFEASALRLSLDFDQDKSSDGVHLVLADFDLGGES
jgi:hypothetical protein